MTQKQIIAQAKQEILSGQDRSHVFNRYKDKISKPIALATLIASIPREELKQRYRKLNLVLFALLILIALAKLVSMIMLVQDQNASIGLVIVGLIVPVIMAIGVFKMEGQIYVLLPILCFTAFINILTHFSMPESFIDLILVSLILGLTLYLKSKLFPTFTWKGPKKDNDGNFIF